MAAKKKQTNEEVDIPKNKVTLAEVKELEDKFANRLLNPSVQAARTLQHFQNEGLNIPTLAKALTDQADEINKGDMSRAESMLICQAHTLDELFNNLARKAQAQTHIPHYESFLRLALKAQGQCRSTLETLSAIKNPPVIFTKQANISHGHQQINNGVPAPSHAEKNQNQQNELLEHTHGKRLDTRTKGQAIGVNSELAALD